MKRKPKCRTTASNTLLLVLLIGIGGTAQVSRGGDPPFEVRFRLAQWRTKHFHDRDEAVKHLEVVKKLGCQTEQNRHNGHVDVKYRCPKWTRIMLPTDDVAHAWIRWLRTAGFETSHEH